MINSDKNIFNIDPDDMPFVFPDLKTDGDDKTNIPLGSGTITSILGRGGMANVYEIWNSDLEVHRAVKLIHPTCTDIERDRFDTEIKITAKLHHPYIVEIHGVGKWNGLSYLEMEKINGISLKDMIKERGALPVPVCTAIGIMISQALQYAHNQEYIIYGKKYNGIIHRDLKPSNIMLCTDGTVKLMDFGIARPVEASFHTMDGTVVGTIHYLPPEQLQGEELDVRTDIYALAATLYEILTGVRAFPENNLSKLMQEKSKNRFQALHEFNITMPAELRRIIHLCMHHSREKRVGSAEALLYRLEKIHDKMTPESPQQVIKNLVNSRSYEKINIEPRSHLRRNLAKAAIIALVLGVSYPLTLGIIHFYKTSQIFRTVSNPDKIKDNNTPIDPLTDYRKQIEQAEIQKDDFSRKRNRNASSSLQTGAIRKKNSAVQPSYPPVVSTTPLAAKTFQDSLFETYGTDNLLDVITRSARAKKYEQLLRVYQALPPESRNATSVLLYKMRALDGLNRTDDLRSFLSSTVIEDGEYYLIKAKLAYQRNDLTSMGNMLDLSLKTPSMLLDRNALKQDIAYYRALGSSARFDQDPSEEHYKNSLGMWHILKTEMKDYPQHYYFNKAVSEMQRIGQQYRDSKGLTKNTQD